MVTSMLEKAIEIEGLLRIIRDGDPLPETYILLNIKAAELAEQAAGLEEKADEPQPETPHADFVMAAPEPQAPGVPEVVFLLEKEAADHTITVAEADAENGTSIQAELPPEDLDLIEEDDILLSFEDPSDFNDDSESPDPNEPQPVATEDTQSRQIDIAVDETGTPDDHDVEFTFEVAGNEGEGSPEDDYNAPEESVVTTEETPSEESHTAADDASPSEPTADTYVDETHTVTDSETHPEASAPTPKRVAKLRASFSLNDRYLYARELFNGNMKMFDSTLDFLEGIDDYSIIEDYFYSELEWNPEDSNVAAFMDILRPNFKE